MIENLDLEQSLAEKFLRYENRLIFVSHGSLNVCILALLTLSTSENLPPEVTRSCDEAAHDLVTQICIQVPSLYPLYEALREDYAQDGGKE